MNIITQEAKKRQAIVKWALKKGKSIAALQYGVSLSSVKRWCKRYDGTWQSLREKSHRPHSHPNRHTEAEEKLLAYAFAAKFPRYGWDGTYDFARELGYRRSFSGMDYATRRMGRSEKKKKKKPTRKHLRRYPELSFPGEKIQIDVKEVPYNCLRGSALRNGKHFYQWTAIDECTRIRYVYGFEEHTPENSVKFLQMLRRVFPFDIQAVQTDNGREFTYKYISETVQSPFEKELKKIGIQHILIPPRTPWHNGKVERSHRNDQRYFYDWETFKSVEELNAKLKAHLHWSNRKTMRTLGRKSPIELLKTKLNIQTTLTD